VELLRTAGALLLAGLAATACTAGDEPSADPTPAPGPSTSASPAPMATPSPVDGRPVVTGGAGPDGLTVRYQDRDGSTKTLRVEDFRR
jgi:hypothetical protein